MRYAEDDEHDFSANEDKKTIQFNLQTEHECTTSRP